MTQAQKAVAALSDHLNYVTSVGGEEAWVAQMRELFKQYLGPEHALLAATKDFRLVRATLIPGSTDRFEIRSTSRTIVHRYEADARAFIEQAIKHIERFGVHQSAQRSFFERLIGRFGWEVTLGIFVTTFGAGYGIGFWHGNNQFERSAAATEAALVTCTKKLDLQAHHIDSLTQRLDSLTLAHDSLINARNHQNKPDQQISN